MKTRKDLLKKIKESNCSIFWKVKAKNLNTKDLEKLVEIITKQEEQKMNEKRIKETLELENATIKFIDETKIKIHCQDFKSINGFNMFGCREYEITGNKIYGFAGRNEPIFLTEYKK